ncbi:hypothetical protein [Halovivax cerinus]|uniref:DUF7969 domain-containing protein n=1 Tax=Halovivax cerinus TaxID=1487865 RepID=A0ABD5NM05_9EURY|nr:hypothetical protein [Halovivax cerinus]
MSVPVRYYCPRCKTIVTLQRAGRLADKSVTPVPLEGWSYADIDGDYEPADGVRIVCGESQTDGEGCGEPYYLNFVRFEAGREIEPVPESERVTLASDGPRRPSSPDEPDQSL